MTAPFFNQTGIGSLAGGGAHSSLAISLTADTTSEVVLIQVTFSMPGSTTPSVTSITGGGLTFARRTGPAQLSAVPIVPSGTGKISTELWWAPATAAFSATVFTVHFSAAVNTATGNVSALGMTVIGCGTPAAPWDTTAGLPASLTGPTPQTITFNTASRAGVTFSDAALAGSVIYFADALVGDGGDELILAFCLDTISGNGTVTVYWSSLTSMGSANDPVSPSHSVTVYSPTFPSTTPTPTPDGIYPDPPVVFLSWSDDKGHTFSNPVGISLGAVGEYITSLQWQRLGLGRSRVFCVQWSSPVRTTLLGAWVDHTPAQT